jgi:integrase
MHARPPITAPLEQARKSMPKDFPPGPTSPAPDPRYQRAVYLISQLQGVARILAECLLISGARPVELLNLRYRDVDHRGMVYIRAAKKGRNRVVLCPPILQLTKTAAPDPDAKIFRRFTYKQFWRAASRVLADKGRVPHGHVPLGRLFRSAYARGNHALSASDLRATSQSLGHASTTSTQHYL